METYKEGGTRMSNPFYSYTMHCDQSADAIGGDLPARSLPLYI
ncbi:MAG: hypothetical protein SVP52_02410 [Chloroflexota bacterium]|nr:hypothetical protein [Chloroflexota bacterium]